VAKKPLTSILFGMLSSDEESDVSVELAVTRRCRVSGVKITRNNPKRKKPSLRYTGIYGEIFIKLEATVGPMVSAGVLGAVTKRKAFTL